MFTEERLEPQCKNNLAQLQQKANAGDAQAQANLGYCYLEGEGISKDQCQAVKWFRQAAEQGNADGQYWLGQCYADALYWLGSNGKNSSNPKFRQVAVECLRKAAAQGHPWAKDALRDMGER